MIRLALAHRNRLLAALAISLFALALSTASAGAVAFSLSSFKTSIDVKLDITENSEWKGIRPGCYAPGEEFGMNYKLRLDSRPKKSSKIKTGIASLTGASFGITPNYGAKGSFKQSGKPSQWTLQTQYPAGCTGAAPAPPPWASSPQCKPISERVYAALRQSDIKDPDAQDGSVLDGTLVLMRVKKASPTFGASIGNPCHRTLQSVYSEGIQSLLEISMKTTIIEVPVPLLRKKMEKLAKGSDKSRPDFDIPIRLSGDCDSMTMTPYTGPDPDFLADRVGQPHQALGDSEGKEANSLCHIGGRGRATVTRVGPVVQTIVPKM
ncbi:MAG: hypothetical protein ACRDKE_04145 [Solirubrobacterales bacterium]